MADEVGPFVSFKSITYSRSFIACLVIAVSYVASLYIYKSPLPRDHPKTIYQRFKSVAVVSLLAPIYVWMWSDDRSVTNQEYVAHSLWKWLGIHVNNIIMAATVPLFLTIAPLTEEFVYRACMLPLLVPCYGIMTSIIICPLFFGVAHVHHVIERLRVNREATKEIWLSALFQFGYTTVFGAYSAFLFVRTGHLIGPVVCHGFCNFMGFPPVEAVPNSKYPKVIAGSFVTGLVIFLLLVLPLTQPSWYNSIYYQ